MKSIILVLDGFGVGEMPDANKFGDVGSNTYVNLKKQKDFCLNNLRKLGLDNIDGLNVPHCENVIGYYGKLKERSINKDTLTGHWEMMGVETHKVYQAFPNKIDDDVVNAVQQEIGQTICNHSASGTQIIVELGQEHIETKKPILYSSQDSVLQIATHKSVYSIEQLYEMCHKVRERMNKDFNIQRIIARPFDTNEAGEFYRTKERKDFAINPPHKTTLDKAIEAGFKVVGVGKIAEIFNFNGISESFKTTNNVESLDKTLELVKSNFDGLIFVNLIDTDMLFGHRNDIDGYVGALKYFDEFLPKILDAMGKDDLLIITGDHGNDPTTPSTDHSREYTPCVMYSPSFESSKNLGIIDGFKFVGDSALSWLTNGGKL